MTEEAGCGGRILSWVALGSFLMLLRCGGAAVALQGQVINTLVVLLLHQHEPRCSWTTPTVPARMEEPGRTGACLLTACPWLQLSAAVRRKVLPMVSGLRPHPPDWHFFGNIDQMREEEEQAFYPL